MEIVYVGLPPTEVFYPYWKDQPLFDIDAVMAFDFGRDLLPAECYKARLAKAHGRPVLCFGRLAHHDPSPPDLAASTFKLEKVDRYLHFLRSRPRTNYESIDCNFYDTFEAAITQRSTVAFTYRDLENREISVATRLRDLQTKQNEEYVQLADGQWIRLDRVSMVNGVAAGESCRF